VAQLREACNDETRHFVRQPDGSIDLIETGEPFDIYPADVTQHPDGSYEVVKIYKKGKAA
jgi:hypothetical protein